MSANRLTKPSATMNRKADLRSSFEVFITGFGSQLHRHGEGRYRTASGSDRPFMDNDLGNCERAGRYRSRFCNAVLNLSQSGSPPLTDSPGPTAIRRPHSGQPSAKLYRESIVEFPLPEMSRACLW